jgi:hypothetical protein
MQPPKINIKIFFSRSLSHLLLFTAFRRSFIINLSEMTAKKYNIIRQHEREGREREGRQDYFINLRHKKVSLNAAIAVAAAVASQHSC